MSFADKILGILIAVIIFIVIIIVGKIKYPDVKNKPFLKTYKKYGVGKTILLVSLKLMGALAINYVISFISKPIALAIFLYIVGLMFAFIFASIDIVANGSYYIYDDFLKKNEADKEKE